MTTYTCKCGKTFNKNITASTTGNRMPHYGPEHECFGCPFVNTIKTWDRTSQDSAVTNHECRGCKEKLFYGTSANCTDSKASTLHVLSLDFDFIQAMTDFYNMLDDVDPMKQSPVPGMDDAHGRLPFSFNFPQNLKGEAAKQKLIEQFFKPAGSEDSYNKMYARKDMSGCGEWETVTHKIRDAKEEAKYMEQEPNQRCVFFDNNICRALFEDTKEISEEYRRKCKERGPAPRCARYYLRRIREEFKEEDWMKLAAMPELENWFNGHMKSRKDGISDNPECTTVPAEEETEQPEQPEQNEFPEFDDDDPDPNNDSDDSGNDSTEPNDKPCDWKNASGADEDEDEDEPMESLPDGPDLSLRLPAFDAIFNAADDALRDMARTLKTKYIESGELNIKIVIDNYGGILRPNPMKSKGNCSLKPAKVSFPIRFSDDVEFTVDADGRVILPDDREHQVSFDEVTPPVTTKVDNNSGLVNEVQTDETEDLPTSDDMTNWVVGQEMHPCDHHDCPFFGVDNDENAGCCYDPQVDGNDEDCTKDIWTAVTMESCERPDVLEVYQHNNPDEADEDASLPDENSDLQFEANPSEANTFGSCNSSSCTFYNADAPHGCSFKADGEYYGALDGYPADEDDVIDSAEEYDCQNPVLMAEYKKVKEQENND